MSKPKSESFITYADHIEEGKRGTLVMFCKPDPEDLEMLVLPYTYCPNVADLLDESNWETIKSRLSEADPDGQDHRVASFGHWVTPYDLMLVRPGTPAHDAAVELMEDYDAYPVLDEDDFSNREQEAYSEQLTDAFNDLSIVANGVTLKGKSNEYTALWAAVDQYLCRSETPEYVGKDELTEALYHLGFAYNDTEMQWEGTIEIPAWVGSADESEES